MKELGKHGHKFLVMGLGLLIILLIIYMHMRNKEGFAPAPRRPPGPPIDYSKVLIPASVAATIEKQCKGQPPPADTLGSKNEIINCYNEKKQTLVSCDGTTGTWKWSCVKK